jgi:hypothetical protein
MKTFDRVDACRDLAERGVHLRQVLKVDRDVPLAQLRWSEAELAAGQAIGD